ncbi:glycerophosphoryl diester phosphodiesterase membrane domain-containing protein [Glutamicibacter sp. AOP38-B1-38]|uniref:glycerophosphoryl diester phosphodiesterase membrane domain-containing protein n=1 Tax=Glutamicibacter sp. AOP38-B1-38 TaxID=3457680 RepID=UPI0040347545
MKEPSGGGEAAQSAGPATRGSDRSGQGLGRLAAHSALGLITHGLRLGHAHVLRYLAVIITLQLVNALAVIPGVKALFTLALESCGLSNLTDRNLPVMLADPSAVLLLLLIAVLVLLAMGLQFSALIVMVNRQQAGLPPTMRGIVSETCSALGRFARYPSPLLMAYLFVVLPLGGLGLSSVLIQGIDIPPFITREYLKTPLSGSLYAAIIGAVIYLNLRLMLTLPMFVVGRRRPYRAIVESLRATRRTFWRSAALLGVPVLASALLMSFIVEFLVWGSAAAGGFLEAEGAAWAASLSIGVGQGLGFLVIGATTVVIIQVLVAATRSRLGLPNDLASLREPAPAIGSRLLRAMGAAAACALVLAGSVNAAPVMAGTFSRAADTAILAHRGFSGGGVENTIGGLEAAAKLQPDYVEADFQETKDGHFVASHDTNLLVVAGRNENIYDMSVAEVTAVTQSVGGFTGKIPTMTEYLNRAAELQIPLLVELKVTGHESAGYLDRFLAEVDATGSAEANIYHSLDPEAVREIKQRRPELQVGLTIAMSIGAIPDVAADFIVVEQASFNPAVLRAAQAEGKPVFVWTVNDEATIRELLSLGVDGIVTDSVDIALHDRELVSSSPRSAYRVGVALAHLDLFR